MSSSNRISSRPSAPCRLAPWALSFVRSVSKTPGSWWRAKTVSVDDVLGEKQSDPVTRAYFRELQSTPIAAPADQAAAHAARPLLALLAAADIELAPAPALLGTGDASEAHPFRNAMTELSLRDPALYARRLEELAFVVNVLSAGGRKEGRAYRPVEAVEDAVEACNVGLRTALTSRPRTAAVDLLTTLSVDRLFRIGWRVKQSASSPA